MTSKGILKHADEGARTLTFIDDTKHAVAAEAHVTLNGDVVALGALKVNDKIALQGDPAVGVTATRP